ncbi:MAG: NUDIX hydrolase [Hyphomicrobiaceae bacterium]
MSLKHHGTGTWQSWYRYLPWEEQRQGGNAAIRKEIMPRLMRWAKGAAGREAANLRRQRIAAVFGEVDQPWNEELVLQRYELLYEAGLAQEQTARGLAAEDQVLGRPMLHDHRRILATGIARLRAKIKYRPVIFELMPETFTFLQLQRAVEAIVGRLLHKQNFRRMIEQQALIEETGETSAETGGRPAKLLRFRKEVVLERAVMGSKLPLARMR